MIIIAEILSVRYTSPNDWRVLEVAVTDPSDTFTAVGTLAGDAASLEGSRFELEGEFKQNPKFGRQFVFHTAKMLVPDDLVGMQRYLESPHFQDIGPVRASQIIQRFGHDAFKVIKEQPHLLTLIRGITPERAERIHNDYMAREKQQETFNWLAAHQIPYGTAVRIEKVFKSKTIEILTEDPYRLMDIEGFAFKRADIIAAKIGVSKNAPCRARAAVLHLFREQSQNGHSVLSRKQVVKLASQLQLKPEMTKQGLDNLIDTGSLQESPPLVGLTHLWEGETEIANFVLGRNRNGVAA